MRYIGKKLFLILFVVSPFVGVWLLGAMEQNLAGNVAEWFFCGIVLFWLGVVYSIKKAEREARRRERRERLSKRSLAA